MFFKLVVIALLAGGSIGLEKVMVPFVVLGVNAIIVYQASNLMCQEYLYQKYLYKISLSAGILSGKNLLGGINILANGFFMV